MWEGFYDPNSTNDGPGFSDAQQTNFDAKHRNVALRDFPGLFNVAQQGFQSPGLGARGTPRLATTTA